MHSTRIYIKTIICGILFLSCNLKNSNPKVDNSNVYLQTRVNQLKNKKAGFYPEVKIDKGKSENGYNYLAIKITLINNTTDTIRYINMSCSWNMVYITDNKRLSINRWGCNRNVPEVLTILPYSNEEEKTLEIETSENWKKLKGLKFRIGFLFVPFRDYESFDKDWIQLFKSKNIIWSDSLFIQ